MLISLSTTITGYRYQSPTGAWGMSLSLFILIGVVGLAGCRVRDVDAQPSAYVMGVEVIEKTREGARLEVVVVLQNPNFVALPLTLSSYTITVEGVGTYHFSDHLRQTLPAGVKEGGSAVGRQTLRLPVALGSQGNSPAGLSYRVQGSVQYQPPGSIRKLLTEANVPLPSIPFEGTGEIK